MNELCSIVVCGKKATKKLVVDSSWTSYWCDEHAPKNAVDVTKKSDIDLWANFLANEKLTPARCGEHLMQIVALCERMSASRGPLVRPYRAKLASRDFVCQTAMFMGIDLSAIKYHGKIAMSRGMLDAWNKEYVRRFGSNFGTAATKEAQRRDVKTHVRNSDRTASGNSE